MILGAANGFFPRLLRVRACGAHRQDALHLRLVCAVYLAPPALNYNINL